MITYKDFGVKKETATLSNGIKVLHFNKKNSPISITFASKSGSRYDPEGKEGLAHFVEHTALMGGKKFKDKKELTHYIENIGGTYGAYTTTELTAFHFCVAEKKLLPYVTTAISEILKNAKFGEDKIESEKKIILNEIDRRENSTGYHLLKGTLKLMLKNHRLTREITGNPNTLNNLTKEDLISHYENYTPKNLCILSCGDVSIKHISSLFEGSVPYKKSDASPEPVDISKIKKSRGVFKKDIKTPNIKISFPISNLLDYKEFIKLKFLINILGIGRNSLLKDRFRNEESILYDISAGNHIQEDFGYAYIEFQVQKEKIPFVIENIQTILKNIQKSKIDKSIIDFTKNRIINSSKISHQTTDSWIDSYIHRALLINDDEHGFISFLNDIKKVTASDLVEIANKYFVEKRMCVFAVGNLEEKDLGQ